MCSRTAGIGCRSSAPPTSTAWWGTSWRTTPADPPGGRIRPTPAQGQIMTPPDPPAVDVHAHAMPMPLLRWLQERGLAELAGAPPSVIRLDPRVSGIAAGAPLPLARSQYEVPDRLAEMDAAG